MLHSICLNVHNMCLEVEKLFSRRSIALESVFKSFGYGALLSHVENHWD